MNRKGYFLMEALVASALLSLASAGIFTGWMQAVKIERNVRETNALYDPFKILWMRASKDLRNTVSLREFLFVGKQEEAIFPVHGPSGVSLIRYFMKDGQLFRSERALPEKLVRERPHEEVLMKGIEHLKFEYMYLDEEERAVFKPIWMEEPYFGIPKAIKIQIQLKNSAKLFSKLVSIPQGQWGHIVTSEAKA